MPFYSRQTIDKINEQVPISDLMNRHGEHIRSRGKTDFFLCPKCGGDWSNSRIDTRKNYYKCFRCAALGHSFQGKPINYIQDRLGLTLVQAVEHLAKEYKIDIQVEDHNEINVQQQLFKDVIDFYQSFIPKTFYFQQRGVTADVVAQAKAGYAPGAVLKKYLIQKGYQEELLKKEGLINNRGMDTWFNRIVLPIIRQGKVIDFYTRRVDNQDYMKHLYLKGSKSIIYGHDQIEPHVEYLDYYEGLMNRLVVQSEGLPAGASIGSCLNFSMAHVHYAKKISPKKGVRIIFDADEKGQGQTQAFHFGELLTKEKIQTSVVMLPNGNDPAEVLTAEGGVDMYLHSLEKAMPYEEYRAHFLMKDIEILHILDHLRRRYKSCSSTTSTFSLLYS